MAIRRDPSDGRQIEICEDLLPSEQGQEFAERLTVEALETYKDDPIKTRST